MIVICADADPETRKMTEEWMERHACFEYRIAVFKHLNFGKPLLAIYQAHYDKCFVCAVWKDEAKRRVVESNAHAKAI